jgi:membrane protein
MPEGNNNNRRRGGWHYSHLWYRTIKIAYLRYYSSGAPFMAAAIAFYCLICLAPVGLLLASVLQHALRSATVSPDDYRGLEEYVQELAGGAADQVMFLIDKLAHSPEPMITGGTWMARLIALGALVWAGMRLFDMIQLALSAIWPGRPLRNYFIRKLISLLMLIIVGLLFVALVALLSLRGAALAWLRHLPPVGVTLPIPHAAVTFGAGVLISGAAYFLLYKFMPARRVPWPAALLGAVLAAVVWQSISPIFTSFIAYATWAGQTFGELGWIIIFGLWAFMGAQVLLIGAQMTAAYDHVFVSRRPRSEDDALIDAMRRRTQFYVGDPDAEAEQIIEELQLDREPGACQYNPAGHEEINGIILAGGRIAHSFAEEIGTDIKGLIPIDGHAAVEYVVAAMRQVPGMRQIVLVGDKPAFVHHPVAEKLDGIIDEGPDIWHNLMRAIRFLNEDRRILLSTSDTPLLTGEALCALLKQCDPQADLCYPVTRRQPTRRLFAGRYWAFLPLREGWVTHTCNALFDPRLVLKNQAFAESFLSRRKDLWTAAGSVGVGFMIRFFLSWYLPFLRFDMDGVGHHIEAITGARRCQGILLDYPEIALDIDRPGDIEVIEEFIRRERAAGNWRTSLE